MESYYINGAPKKPKKKLYLSSRRKSRRRAMLQRIQQKKYRLEVEKEEFERVIELSKIECGPPSTYVTHYTMEEEMQNIQNHYNEDYAEEEVVYDTTTFENSMVNLKQMMDEDYNLCQFLYHEMKSLSSADIKRKLHLTVQKALLEASRQDEVEKLEKIAV